jgi:hypothetical protein
MADSSSIKIYIFHYKNGFILEPNSVYTSVMSGKSLLNGENNIQGDDTGESFSAKNPWYSELPGIYWVWKNTTQPVTGACHYRRFFTAFPEPFIYRLKRLLYFPAGIYRKRLGLIYTSNVKQFKDRILNEQDAILLLNEYDAILPQARVLKYSVETHFNRYHSQSDLQLLENILVEKHPDCLEAFQEVIRGKRLYANNMFVMRDEHYQEFMIWWFDVLFEFERRIDLNHYTDYQKRIMGFIAERLLNVWFAKKKLKCVELPVVYFKKFKYS